MTIKVAFIDLDGTLIKGQSQALFIKFLKKKKMISNFQSFVILFWFFLYKLQILKNTDKILTYALSCFKGKPFENVLDYVNEFIMKVIRTHYYKDVRLFLDDMRSKKIKLVLLSTAVDMLVKKIAEDLDIKEFIATQVEIDNGIFTGAIIGIHVYGPKKLIKIKEWIARENIAMEDVLVLADNYSDKEILLKAGTGIVANPDIKMKRWALQNNLRMIYLDKYEPV